MTPSELPSQATHPPRLPNSVKCAPPGCGLPKPVSALSLIVSGSAGSVIRVSHLDLYERTCAASTTSSDIDGRLHHQSIIASSKCFRIVLRLDGARLRIVGPALEPVGGGIEGSARVK